MSVGSGSGKTQSRRATENSTAGSEREDGATGERDRRRDAQRHAIEEAALRLLDEGGPQAVTSRAVSAAAGVQAMSIYRLFGDMDELIARAAAKGFAEYVAAKANREQGADPVGDLRVGWDLHVGFGLSHPYVYAQIYGRHAPGQPNPAAEEAAVVLRGLLQRVAEAGRLTRDVESAAVLIHSAGCGVTLTLMSVPPDRRDMSISDLCRETILAAVTVPTAGALEDGAGQVSSRSAEAARHAVSLAAVLSGGGDWQPPLTEAESGMLSEWLDRLS
ncbi:TetR/AcrR family transcriptional regulator [Nocardia sp. NPDC049220]|uniref:TetR/AcrR family transcriptional regulator n=1 Tax=Nocardia sp. NPDC049220 TaxID=3155273 RepID=UPI0033EE93A2